MIRAWHFLNGDKLRDGSTAPPDGEWLHFYGGIVMCESGLHASIDPFDALKYAPGNTLCLVDCDGKIMQGDDKLVCSMRRIVVRMDAEPLLRYFARQQALSVVHLWDAPDVVLAYLMGDDTAGAAAQAAAGAAAWDAAWDAAWAATRKDFNALVNEAFEDWL
jgi:hypothetical protein